jgi:membrane-bound lytic murein transglycosylase A
MKRVISQCSAVLVLLWFAACTSKPPRTLPQPASTAIPPSATIPPAANTVPSTVPTAPEAPPQLQLEPVAWSTVPGWKKDALVDAAPAMLASCNSRRLAAVWSAFCEQFRAVNARDTKAQRRLYETKLRPYRITTLTTDGAAVRKQTGLITAYYEPVLNGSKVRGGRYQTPLYAVPDDLVAVELGELYPTLRSERLRGRLQGRRITPYPSRAELADGKMLAGKELVWVDSAIDAFFLQIQGSGRVRFEDGSVTRLSFADVNGHPYRSIARYLVDRGDLTVAQTASSTLQDWLRSHPERLQEVFNSNPSVVFFKQEALGDPALGPRGALNVPLTAGRSVAIDPRQLPLGAPLFLSTSLPTNGMPLQRLVLGQDSGGAIRGAIRADLFWGMGSEAGKAAGGMRQEGAMWLLWPTDSAPPKPAVQAN